MSRRRVVVTGLGLISPVGNDVATGWANLVAGRGGIGPITKFDASAFPCRIAGEVRGFDVSAWMPAKEARHFDTFIHYGIAAAAQAVADAGISADRVDPDRIGVIVGSGIGGLPMIEENHTEYVNRGVRRISPFFVPGSIVNMVSGQVSIMHGFRGPNYAVVSACTTGLHSIGDAGRLIEYGDADVMIAGGAEATVSPLGIGGFCAARAMSTRNDDPGTASRPWDKDRDGFVLGEGAGVLVLEEYEHAKRRGARIYGELAGYGMSADAHHITAPDRDGPKRGMLAALRNARLNGDAIQYVNAHGTSTPLGDEIELKAVERLVGNAAADLVMSSTKSSVGHLLGAAGAIEAIFSILAIRDGVAPATLNLDNPSVDTPVDLVPHTPRYRSIDVALSNSFGFGGTNASLIVGKVR